MADAYSIASRLTFTTNAQQIVSELFRSFERLDKVIASTQGNLNRLATELSELNRGGRGLGRSVDALERLSRVQLSGTFVSGIQQVSQDLQKAAAAAKGVGRLGAVPSVAGSGGASAPAGSGRARADHGDLLNAGMAAGQLGDMGMGFFGDALKAEVEIRTQLAALRMNTTVSDKDLADARAKAEEITKLTPGTTTAGNLKTIVEAYTALGDLHEAMIGAPAMAQMSYILENLPGAHRGHSAFAAAQAVEVMQRMYDPKTGAISMEAFNQQLAAMTQVALGTQGRAGPEQFLAFARQSRVSGMVANDAFLYRDLPAMMIALGGNRAGTGEAATFQQFITGRMTEDAANRLKATGLLDAGAEWKGGQVQGMAQHFKGYGTFGANPVEWVRQYMLGSGGALAANKIDPGDRLAVAKFLSDWSSRQTGLGFMSEMTLGMQGINKEGTKIQQTTQNPMSILRQSDPMQQVREFRAAENELMVALGKEALGPAIEALKSLTGVVKELAQVARDNPTLAKDLVLVGGGLSVLGVGAGKLALVIYTGAPLVTGVTALAGALTTLGGAVTSLLSLPALAIVLGGTKDPIAAQKQLETLGRQRRADPMMSAPSGDGFDVMGRPIARPQSFMAPPAANGNVFNISVKIDDRDVAHHFETSVGRRMNMSPPSGTMGSDTRVSPYAGSLAI